jgi:hypothetical protein
MSHLVVRALFEKSSPTVQSILWSAVPVAEIGAATGPAQQPTNGQSAANGGDNWT